MYAKNIETIDNLVKCYKEGSTRTDDTINSDEVISGLAGLLYVLCNRSDDNARYLEYKLLSFESQQILDEN